MPSSDKPISIASEDCFSRNDFAKQISEIISKRVSTDSLVIGLYGRWGDGKTSVLNLLRNELEIHNDVNVIEFNPWFYRDQSKMLDSFFEKIAASIGKVISTKELAGRILDKYLIPIFSIIKQREVLEAINKNLKSVDIEEKKKEVNKLIKKANKKFVFLIDDIDRLDNEEIFLLFKILKMNLDFYNTVFVLAFDYEIVTSALSTKYPSSNNNGANFIEKIVQVPLDLPIISIEKLQYFCFHQIDEILQKEEISITEEEIQRFQNGFTPGLSIRLSTPRMITRYINVLSIYIPILKDEININDLMLIEGIRVCYPIMYDLIKKNKDAFLIKDMGLMLTNEREKGKKEQKIFQLINEATRNNTNDEKIALEKILSILFPQLNHILKNNIFTVYDEKEITKNKQIASDDYFARYFLYSIPENDISDSSLEEFLNSLENHFASFEDISEKLKYLVDTKNANGFLRKIFIRVENLSTTISQNLAMILSMNSQLFPKQNNNTILFSTYSLSARLIAELICNEHDQKLKVSFSEKIIEISEPLPFSVEIMRSLRTTANSDLKQFSSEEIEMIREVLIKKVEKYSRKFNLFIQYPDEVGMLLYIWQNGKENNNKVETYFKNKTKDYPNLILVFLSSLLGVYFSASGVEKADLTRDNFEVIKNIIDPAYIMNKLEELYGKKLDSDFVPRHRQDIDLDFRTASQFAYFYNHPDVKEDDNGLEM